MTRKSVIKLPDGTIIEVSPDMSPDQIHALISAVTASGQPIKTKKESSEGKTIIMERSPEDIWNTSKRERVALFIRNYFSAELWFTSKDVMDQQLAILQSLHLGETSAIGTYLNRLFETGFLDRKKMGRSVSYRITGQLLENYPEIKVEVLKNLIVK